MSSVHISAAMETAEPPLDLQCMSLSWELLLLRTMAGDMPGGCDRGRAGPAHPAPAVTRAGLGDVLKLRHHLLCLGGYRAPRRGGSQRLGQLGDAHGESFPNNASQGQNKTTGWQMKPAVLRYGHQNAKPNVTKYQMSSSSHLITRTHSG